MMERISEKIRKKLEIVKRKFYFSEEEIEIFRREYCIVINSFDISFSFLFIKQYDIMDFEIGVEVLHTD